eukprot:m.90723 g.90723  ORF g.90723 m.90723 type:complete len:259 (+) comp36664_c0_seq20:256-1032(+)
MADEKLNLVRQGIGQFVEERAQLKRQLESIEDRRAEAEAKLDQLNCKLSEAVDRNGQLDERATEGEQKVERSHFQLKKLSEGAAARRRRLDEINAEIESVEKCQDDDVAWFSNAATEIRRKFKMAFSSYGVKSLVKQLEDCRITAVKETAAVEERRQKAKELQDEVDIENVSSFEEESQTFWKSTVYVLMFWHKCKVKEGVIRIEFQKDYEMAAAGVKRQLEDQQEKLNSAQMERMKMSERLNELTEKVTGPQLTEEE